MHHKCKYRFGLVYWFHKFTKDADDDENKDYDIDVGDSYSSTRTDNDVVFCFGPFVRLFSSQMQQFQVQW